MNQQVKTPAPEAAPVPRSSRTETLQKIHALVTSQEKRQNLATLLGPGINVDLFIQVLMTAIQETPQLLECDIASIWSAARKAAQDGLLPDGREGKIIVRSVYNKTIKGFKLEAGWQTMIAGIRKKVRRSGEVTSFTAELVFANDKFLHQRGDDPRIEHYPTLDKDRGPIIAAYAIATLKSGDKIREVMPIHELHEIRDRYSDGWKAYKAQKIKTTPWADSEGEMCKKTVARRLAKVLPMDTDVRAVIEHDDDDALPGAQEHDALPAQKQNRPVLSDFSQEASGVTIDMSPDNSDDAMLAQMAGGDEPAEAKQTIEATATEVTEQAKPVVEAKPATEEGTPTKSMKLMNLKVRLQRAPREVQNEIWDTEVAPSSEFTDEEKEDLEKLLKTD